MSIRVSCSQPRWVHAPFGIILRMARQKREYGRPHWLLLVAGSRHVPSSGRAHHSVVFSAPHICVIINDSPILPFFFFCFFLLLQSIRTGDFYARLNISRRSCGGVPTLLCRRTALTVLTSFAAQVILLYLWCGIYINVFADNYE